MTFLRGADGPVKTNVEVEEFEHLPRRADTRYKSMHVSTPATADERDEFGKHLNV